MSKILTFSVTISLVALSSAVASPLSRCKESPKVVSQCFKLHGRLVEANGTPTFRIFRIGTKRILGVLGVMGRSIEDNEGESNILPPNVSKIRNSSANDGFGNDVYGDYQVCPLLKKKPRFMQFVCIEKASKLVAKPN